MRRLLAVLLVAAGMSAYLGLEAAAQGTATYRLTFTSTWSASTHPQNFPSNPHFSGLIGATHNSSVVFWATGELASLGIKNMAELGNKAALSSEVNQAIDAGTADRLLDGGGIGNSPGSRRMTFQIRPEYPLVTVTSMLAPSPDWFVGVSRLALLEDRHWVDSLTIELFVYDAGTDSGPIYTSPNQPTNPQEPIARIVSAPFLVSGSVRPVGTFTFELQSVDLSSEGYYTTNGQQIVNPLGEAVAIKGIGLGGWLMPEGYMLHIDAPNGGGPTAIRNQMIDLIGQADTERFFELYTEKYVQEKDIEQIAEWGFDHIRLPFHYRLFYDPDANRFKADGFELLDRFLEWCKTHGLGVILDMHAAPGAQSDGGIADSDGTARLWTEPEKYWPQTVRIWREIARRYNDEKVIIGYDLINEPVTPEGVHTVHLRELYQEIIDAVRPIDPQHILFLEGNFFATAFGDLEPPLDNNMVYTFHKYWNGTAVNSIQYLLDLRSRTDKPLWLGETGENSNPWFYRVTRLMEQHNIGINWWTHKKIETTTSPLSAPFSPGYQAVVDYWRGQGQKPSEEEAERALFGMAQNLDLDSCRVNPGLLAAIFEPEFGSLRRPLREHTIPGVINAADYDIGDQGVTYSDSDVMATTGTPGGGNNGTKYRNDGVDIEASTDSLGFGYNVGWTQRLEWMTYTVTVAEDGMYDVDVRVASAVGNAALRLLLNDERLGEDITVGSTGGWQNWQTASVKNLEIAAGTHILKILVVEPNVNINRLTFTPATPTAVEESGELPIAPAILSTYPNPFVDEVRIDFVTPQSARVHAEFYDVLGRRVFETAEAAYAHGEHTIALRPELAPGVYMFRLIVQQAGTAPAAFTRSLVIMR